MQISDRVLLFVGFALANPCLLACSAEPTVVAREDEPEVIVYPPGDASMDRAIADARASVQGFVSMLPALEQEGAYFSVKAPVPTQGDTEHIWLASPSYRDGTFHGQLGNEPLSPELSLGDPYSVEADQISDWMVVRAGELYGGYTIFVARDQLDPGQRRELEGSLGFALPERPRSF